jgi:signal transduction histidine kinase
VRVFAETDPSGTRIFIRDTGAGFSIDQVPADRRGLRDAIIGRMDHVDGTVSIDSGDHGTEIELHLPARSR